jgi:8-oxo-dGTP pyrophosphatase MutT (NUDIX family)
MTRQSVSIVVLDDDGLFLQVSRRNDPNDFGLPGGKVEADETLLGAAKRELLEETGYEASRWDLLMSRPSRTTTCYVFVATDLKKISEPRPGEGVVRWASPEMIVSGTFSEFNAHILRTLVKRGVNGN